MRSSDGARVREARGKLGLPTIQEPLLRGSHVVGRHDVQHFRMPNAGEQCRSGLGDAISHKKHAVHLVTSIEELLD
jgi:hypothetical protein